MEVKRKKYPRRRAALIRKIYNRKSHCIPRPEGKSLTQAGKVVRQRGTKKMACGGLCFLGGDWNFISKIYQVTAKRGRQYMPTVPVPWGKRRA